MNTLSKLMNWPGAVLGFLAIVGFFTATPARAAHDHDHIYVTMVEYLGYDRSSEHYMIKVRTARGGVSILHFLSNVTSLRGHNGERMQISLGDDAGLGRSSPSAGTALGASTSGSRPKRQNGREVERAWRGVCVAHPRSKK